MNVGWTLKTSFLLCLILGLMSSSFSFAREPYTRPLWFDVVNHGVKVDGPFIQYDLQSSDGQSLIWGPLKLGPEFFSVNLTSRQKLDADSSKMAFYNQEDMVLFFDWPREIIPYGQLEVSDSKSQVIWKKSLLQGDLTAWQQKILQVKEQLRKQGKKEPEIESNSLLKKAYAFFRSKSEPGPDLKVNEGYKFCLKNSVGESFVRICTASYVIKISGTQIEMRAQTHPSKNNLMVTFQNGLKNGSGKFKIDTGKPVQFSAQLKSGASVEFKTTAPALKIYDMVLSDEKTPGKTRTVAENPRPLFLKSEALSSSDPLDLINKLWTIETKTPPSKIYLPGEAGAFFQYDLQVRRLPAEKNRAYVSSKNLNTTYNHDDTWMVRRGPKNELMEWTTVNPEKGRWNRSYLNVPGEKVEAKPYLDIYRGYAAELSARLSALSSSGKASGVGELHFSYWFNSIVGWDSYYLSRQRWGLSLRYLTLLTPIQATTETGEHEDLKFQSLVADLKYRLSPGLWERDESWGPMLSYENLTYGNYQNPRLGAGLFWARPMPGFLDNALNTFAVFRYPKWVDLELIKYFSSMDSTYKVGDDYVVNFHGKINWTPTFFGEAGFGLKKVQFTEKNSPRGGTLNTFYGTLGLGLNF